MVRHVPDYTNYKYIKALAASVTKDFHRITKTLQRFIEKEIPDDKRRKLGELINEWAGQAMARQTMMQHLDYAEQLCRERLER